MSPVFLELTSDKGGLAYSVYYYERFMSGSPRTRTIAVDGSSRHLIRSASENIPIQRKFRRNPQGAGSACPGCPVARLAPFS